MALLPRFFTVRVFGAPLPTPFVDALREVEVETSTEQAGIFRLNFDLSQTAVGDWDALQFDIFRPLVPVQVRVHLGRGISETIINGFVQEARLNNQGQPGKSTLSVVGLDATATLMNLQHKIFPWPNLPDSAVAAAIFAQYGIVPLPFVTPPRRVIVETTTIQRDSDIRFLRQLAQRNSFECYVQPDPLVGTDFGYFGPPKLLVPPQGVLSVNFGLATNMASFDVRYEMLRPTSALAVAMDDATRTAQSGVGMTAQEPTMGREPTLLRIVPPPLLRLAGTDSANAAELMANAQGIANRSSRAVRGSGEVDGVQFGRVLRPGLPVLVRGAGLQHSGLYYVSEVKHSLSVDHYTQHFEAWRNAVGLTGGEVFIDPLAALG